MRKISIILLWWSRTPELEQMAQDCLKSVLENTKYPDYNVIVIENKSMHPSKFLKEFKHPKVEIHLQDTNLGFVKGNNLGFKLAGKNDVLLLNNDTQVPAGWLEPIVQALDMFPECGMIMPKQIHKGSSEFRRLDGNIPNILKYMNETIEKYKPRQLASELLEDNWLPLCATAITRKAIDKVGDLDEKFLLGGFEDVDYSWRLIDAGFKIFLTSGSVIFHHYGQSFHFHGGYSEVWVETGKYLMKTHDATQDVHNNIFRLRKKSKDWISTHIWKLKEGDLEKYEKIHGAVPRDIEQKDVPADWKGKK